MYNTWGQEHFDFRETLKPGVLAPGFAHARPSAQPPIDTSRNFPAHMSAENQIFDILIESFSLYQNIVIGYDQKYCVIISMKMTNEMRHSFFLQLNDCFKICQKTDHQRDLQ